MDASGWQRVPSRDEILYIACSYPVESDLSLTGVRTAATNRGEMTGEEFMAVVRWKSSRAAGHAKHNFPTNTEGEYDFGQDAAIRRISRSALDALSSVPHGKLQPAVVRACLDLLYYGDDDHKMLGVGTAVASSILMCLRPDTFTVIDWRAWLCLAAYGRLEIPRALRPAVAAFSCGQSTAAWREQMQQNNDRFDTYASYLTACHGLSELTGVALRNVDRCMWVLAGAAVPADAYVETRQRVLADAV